MARNIGADGATVYRAVITKTYADGRTYTAHEGPYTEPGPARARLSFWRNRFAAYDDGSHADGNVEQAHTVWTPIGEQAEPTAAIRAQAYRDAADEIAAAFHGEPFLNYPPDFADLLRRRAGEIHTAEEADQ